MQLGEIYDLASNAFNIDFEDAVEMKDAYGDRDKFLFDIGYQMARKELISNEF